MDENNKVLETENINDEYIPDELSYDNASFEDVSTEVEAEKEKKSWQRELYEWVSAISVAVVLALVINTFCFRWFRLTVLPCSLHSITVNDL